LKGVACLAALLLACGSTGLPEAPPAAAPAAPEERADHAAPAAAEYVGAPRPNGVVGGPDATELARSIAGALTGRGDTAEPDGALAATARWFLAEVVAGRPPTSTACERTARRFGYVGTVVTAVAFDLDHPEAPGWREAMAGLPRNLPLTRFSVYVSPGARVAAVVIGAVEATLRPFPRRLAAGGTLRLSGEVAPRFSKARVYVTRPDGTVARASEGARQFDATLTLTAPGAYQVEVMGDGATGPVIVLNAPVYVGVAEVDDVEGKGPVVTAPPAVEARVATLVNEARARLGLAPLAADAELRGLALAHDEDMVAHHFFGHVSPTTGTFDDRTRRANLRVAAAGENVAQAHDADTAFRSLMESPAHRANMVNPRFTHVGIAAVTDGDSGNVDVTLVFARRAPVITSRPTSADLQQRAQAARRAKGLAAVTIDPALQGAAEAGAAALQAGASLEAALAATGAELRRHPRRHVDSSPVCTQLAELFELDDLQERPYMASGALRQLGLAAALVGDAGARKLWLLSAYTGPRCHE
jgi:uncharacterized protein YkwD